jgi:hypothetical protein
MSVDFDPVSLTPSRRRVDPVVLGVAAVVVALAFAVVKPWDAGPDGRIAMASSTPARSALEASAAPTDGQAIRLVSARAPIWADLAPVVTPHDRWGVRAIALDPSGRVVAPSAAAFADLWSPAILTPAGARIAFVERDDRSVVVLGVTVPRAEEPVDARIWRVRRDGQLEWVTAVPILSGDVNGSFLYLRPGVDESPFAEWGPGDYRIDVLVAGGVRQLDVDLPDRFGFLPPLDDAPPSPVITVAAADSDLSGVPAGPFATTDGVGVPLSAMPYRPLREYEAWDDLVLYDGAHVASVSLPRASGLGVMLSPGALLGSATIARLSPSGPPFEAPAPVEQATEHPPSRFVIFPAPGGGAWRPGVYAISVTWTDDSGPHEGTWHIELRPDGG